MTATSTTTLLAACAAALAVHAVMLAAVAAPQQSNDAAEAPQDDVARLNLAGLHYVPVRVPPREFVPEEPCSRAGGLCLAADECPQGQLASPGLCPRQRAQGVECCHGLSVLETRCGRRGGECRASNCTVRDDHARDCGYGENCCILVAL